MKTSAKVKKSRETIAKGNHKRDKPYPKDMKGYTVVLVTGTRHATEQEHYKIIKEELECVKDERVVLVHGNCRGVDLICDRVAREKSWRVYPVKALWGHYDNAGSDRNQEMIDLALPHYVFAFPTKESVGTVDCIKRVQHHRSELLCRMKTKESITNLNV